MSTLFFVVNPDPFDGSAHGLYCLRECRALAEAAPENAVRLVYPGALSNLPGIWGRRDGETGEAGLLRMGLSAPHNLHLHPLPALRRARGRRGVTVNAVYYWACLLFLRRRMRPGDVLASASFAGLTGFLYRWAGQERNVRRVYEVHQLAQMERGPESKAAQIEQAVLEKTDVLLTTTEMLRGQLQELAPGKPVINLGLACGFDPETVPPPEQASRPFTLAYIGSLYPEQGVQWLTGVWEEVVERIHAPARLRIAGGTLPEVEALRDQAAGREKTVLVHGPVAPGNLPIFLRDVDALIIPALNRGRMPYVAITKAYDYLGLNRPILAANLPSIAEVLRPEREALLFAPENAAGVAEALTRIMRETDLVRTLTAHCRSRREEFTWENRSTAWWRAVQS
jgi:glycosyltransferase involved in cell wall biosynthesis